MKYFVNDFGKEEYLDGILCKYSIENNDDIIGYVFEKEHAEFIARKLNESLDLRK